MVTAQKDIDNCQPIAFAAAKTINRRFRKERLRMIHKDVFDNKFCSIASWKRGSRHRTDWTEGRTTGPVQ